MSTQKSGAPITGYMQPSQPSANPFAKVVYAGVESAFGNNIYGDRRASVVAQGSTTDMLRIAPNETCGNGLPIDTTTILGFGTQQLIDSYLLPIAGSPSEVQPGNLFTQNIGPSSTSAVFGFKVTKGGGGRKLPWMTDEQQGDGIILDAYGNFDRILPDGSTHTAPGSTDPIVNIKRCRVKLAATGATAISGLTFAGDADATYGNKGLAVNVDGTTVTINGSNQLVASGGGGGGGGSTGPGAATYTVAADTNTPSGVQTYLPWDTNIKGDNVYLNVSNTDGLTIPAGGDGDYWVDAQAQVDTSGALNNFWSVQYFFAIEHWRAGSRLIAYRSDSLFQQDASIWGQNFSQEPLQVGTAICGAQAGDVIKVSVTAQTSGTLGTPLVYGDSSPNEQTWVSITRTGKVSSSGTAATYQMSNNPATTSSTQLYVPWDTILYGHDMYLDVAHTDGLTIPVGGDGDYHIDTELLFQDGTTSTTPPWDIQFWLSIEVWRAGVRQQYLVDQDEYGSEASFSNTLRQFKLSATMPSLLAGDVVKIGWFYTNGSGPTFGFQWIDNTQSNCWVSIAKFG